MKTVFGYLAKYYLKDSVYFGKNYRSSMQREKENERQCFSEHEYLIGRRLWTVFIPSFSYITLRRSERKSERKLNARMKGGVNGSMNTSMNARVDASDDASAKSVNGSVNARVNASLNANFVREYGHERRKRTFSNWNRKDG